MEVVMWPNELWIGDMEIESMGIIVWFFVTVTKRPVISQFEIKGQGSVFSFDPVDYGLGKPLEIDIVTVHKDTGDFSGLSHGEPPKEAASTNRPARRQVY